MKRVIKTLLSCLSLLFLLIIPQQVHAFYEWVDDDLSVELRGFLVGSAVSINNPDNSLFYRDKNISGMAASGRLMMDVSAHELYSFELHLVQGYTPNKLQTGGSAFAVVQGVERSDLLDWGFDRGQSHFQFDRLNLQYASSSLSVKLGRQPINLAATNYFSPNDFFAPFSAQTFFRTFKPGVDALRVDAQLSDSSQLSFISVLGYQADVQTDSGWNNRFDMAKTSGLIRASTLFSDFEVALFAGIVRRDHVFGIDIQGELFDWLGLRGEGHLNQPDQAGLKDQLELALGLEHRWENSLTLNVEQFYHGAGASQVSNYALTGNSYYLARNYSAVGGSYEVTPLLTGNMALLYNWLDKSALLSLYALYSLSDETELAFSYNHPAGGKPTGPNIRSEFGLYPVTGSVELRSYF